MSKLFETLEKIREREALPQTSLRSPGNTGHSRRERIRFFLLAVVTFALVIAVFLTYGSRTSPGRNTTSSSSPAAPAIAPSGHRPEATKADNDPVSLNFRGCRLVEERKYWPAIILFQKAAELVPRRPEPLINMAVALSELGLFGPAAEKLNLAAAISPRHPALLRNLEILEQHGIILNQRPTVIRIRKEER